MTTKTQITFEEYLNYDDCSDRHYEFVDGKLVAMLPESITNADRSI